MSMSLAEAKTNPRVWMSCDFSKRSKLSPQGLFSIVTFQSSYKPPISLPIFRTHNKLTKVAETRILTETMHTMNKFTTSAVSHKLERNTAKEHSIMKSWLKENKRRETSMLVYKIASFFTKKACFAQSGIVTKMMTCLVFISIAMSKPNQSTSHVGHVRRHRRHVSFWILNWMKIKSTPKV